MAIHKLENVAVRAIGASQVLTDPATVVKEFIDNALDAHATSVAIEIHSNTLDVIQVRDNGHGIAAEDRSMVATPNCTSKLVNIDDLRDLGGSSLGFRGQALASAAEMSGSLTISTRVEGELVATALKINQRGEVVGQERASLPVGTTVRITDFIKANPVRRQVALKNTEKCSKRIKQMLQGYAFARPHVRLSLRVLKSKNDKGNWMYAPKHGSSVEDAALKIVGSACSSQCTWYVVEDHGFALHALLPRPDADSSKISNIGAFISVDARPVSASRGTMKQVMKIFRDSLKAASPSFDGVKEPFVYLRIACPLASYDPNIEPAKDDVLFEYPDVLVGAARQLFATAYPAREKANGPNSNQDIKEVTSVESLRPPDDEDDFVTSLEPARSKVSRLLPDEAGGDGHARQLHTPLPTSDAQSLEMHEDRSSRPHRKSRSNMYGCDEEDLELLDARPPTGRTEADFEELRQAKMDVTVSNPWVVAKMNATLRRPETTHGQEETQMADIDETARLGSPVRRGRLELNPEASGLPTPRTLSPSLPAPSDHVPDLRLLRDGRLIGSQTLPSPRVHMLPLPASNRCIEQEEAGAEPARHQPAYDYTVGSHAVGPAVELGTPLQAIPDASRPSRRSPRKPFQQGQVNRPFVSPVMDQSPRERVWFDHLEQEGRPKHRRPYPPRDSNGLVRQGELGDLVDDPRPLTPPRRNRDIRDFVGSVDITGSDSAASFIERRNYGQTSRRRSVGAKTRHPSEAVDENLSPTKAVLSARGFIPASELAAIEAHLSPASKGTPRPPKRRKTSESRILREVSGNAAASAAPADDGEDGEYRPAAISRTASRRRRTADGSTGKVHRTKSSRLPLERVPAGQGMHNVGFEISSSLQDVSRWAGKVDEERSLLGWNEPALDAYDSLSVVPVAAEMQDISTRLRELLIDRVSDGEMVQDLDVLLQDAFA